MSKELEYNASSIELPTDLEHIRMRRGMYIGETLDPRQLLSEALDNALDESLAGHSSKPIQVIVDTKISKYRVRDYGRGIPHGEITDANGIDREVLEVLSTKAFSGAKFSGGSYATPVGLHGLGMSCVCALSEDVSVSTYREGKAVQLTAHKGGNVEVTKFDTEELDGVDIVFVADGPMFDSIEIPMDFILDRCRVAKAFGSDIVLTVDGEVIDIPVESIEDLIIIDKKVSQYSSDSFEYTADDGESIRVALKYTSEVTHKTTGYSNLLLNRYGGTHVRLIERAVCDVWEDFTKSTSVELKRDDVLLGLNTLVAVFLSEVEFTSQTKDRLSVPNRDLTILIDGFKEQFKQHLIDNPKLRTALLKRFEEYRISQNKMLSQKEIMNLVKVNEESSGSMRRRSVVPKLIECTSNSKEGTEIYICEGDSAAGPIARSRDRATQAVLPLRGKIKNITHHSIKEALASEEVRNIVNSIGAGVGTDSDPEKSRYERVIIMTDSDPDGAHIIALIVSVLVNLVPNLMKAGMVYVCEAPLYGWTEDEMEFSNDFEEIPDKIRSKGNYTRFKGLGMMDDDEFKESCLNPEKRFLFRVDYPSDIEKFNHILGSSAGKSELMKDLGVLVDTR